MVLRGAILIPQNTSNWRFGQPSVAGTLRIITPTRVQLVLLRRSRVVRNTRTFLRKSGCTTASSSNKQTCTTLRCSFIHSFIHTRFQLSAVGLLCRHGPASAPVAEVRVTAFGNSHFTSSLCSDQQPPPLDGLAPIYDYLHRRLKECFI